MLEHGPRPPSALSIVYLSLALPVVLFLALVAPPFRSAGEADAFLRAVEIARAPVATQRDRMVDGAAADFVRILSDPAAPDGEPDPAKLAATAALAWGAPKVRAPSPAAATGIRSVLLLLPAAAAVKAGMLAGLPVRDTFSLARLLDGLLATVLATASIALCGKGRAFLALLLSFPLALSLFGSLTTEGLALAAAALAAGLWSHHLERDEAIPLGRRCLAALLLGAAAAADLSLAPLLVLALLPTMRRDRLRPDDSSALSGLFAFLVALIPIALRLFDTASPQQVLQAVADGSVLAPWGALVADPAGAMTVLRDAAAQRWSDIGSAVVGPRDLGVVLPGPLILWCGGWTLAALLVECTTPDRGVRGYGVLALALAIGAALVLAVVAPDLEPRHGGGLARMVGGVAALAPLLLVGLLLPSWRDRAAGPRGPMAGALAGLACAAVGLSNLWFLPIALLHRLAG